MGNCERGRVRPKRLDMEGMGLGDREEGRSGSMYVVFENICRGRSGALRYLWVDSSFDHRSIYHQLSSIQIRQLDLPVRRNPIRSPLLTPWTPPNSFFLTVNHPQSRLILLIIPPTPIFNTIVMERGITSLIMARNDFWINHIDPHCEW
jgi:hypothetical protein